MRNTYTPKGVLQQCADCLYYREPVSVPPCKICFVADARVKWIHKDLGELDRILFVEDSNE